MTKTCGVDWREHCRSASSELVSTRWWFRGSWLPGRYGKQKSLAGPVFVLVYFIIGEFTGVSIIYWFRDCDPVLRGAIKSYDQIVPYHMMKNLADVPLLRGLFLAGLVGSSTSTVSSIVNSHAAIFYVDVVTPYVKLNEKKAVVVMRLLAFASGTIMTLGAIAVPYLGTAARLFMSFYSSAAGPFSGLFLLALSSPWVNAKGAGCATLLVCVFLLWHAVGRGFSDIPPVPVLSKSLDRCPLQSNASDLNDYSASVAGVEDVASSNVFPLYLVSFYWISFIGALLTIILGTALSLMTGGHKTTQRNVRLTSPVFLNIWKRFRCLRRTMTVGDALKSVLLRTDRINIEKIRHKYE
uniref:Sodium dependent multivitamin transporter n=1 Tax=Rhipicephalus appendiculatus TaxID=34631 RepID=A0A131YFC0_RHIAP